MRRRWLPGRGWGGRWAAVDGLAVPARPTETGHAAEPGHDEPADPGHDEPGDPGHDEPADPGQDEPADPGQDDTVDVGGPITYRRWEGRGDRTIVCVHGLGGSRLAWAPQAEHLARHGRVLALDLPGFGQSPRAGRPATMAAAGEMLSRFVAATVDGPAVLMGTSFGGAVATWCVAHSGHPVQGLILSSSYLPPFYGTGRQVPVVMAALAMEEIGTLAHQWRRHLLRKAGACGPPSTRRQPADPDGARARRRATRDTAGGDGSRRRRWERRRAFAEAVASLAALAIRPEHVWRHYDAVRCPVLLLHGAEDDQVPVAWARAAQRRHPAWELHVLPGVHHVVKLASPTWWFADVDRWFGDLDRVRPTP